MDAGTLQPQGQEQLDLARLARALQGVQTARTPAANEINHRTTVPLGLLWSAVACLVGGVGSVLLMFWQINQSMEQRYVSVAVFQAEMQSLRNEMALRQDLLLTKLSDLGRQVEGTSKPESRR